MFCPTTVAVSAVASAAAATILARFCGTDQVPFTVGSDTLPGVLRTYTSFTAAAEEIGWSRIYGGIHFLSADLDGLEAGHRLGNYVWQRLLRPVPDAASLEILDEPATGQIRLTLRGTPNHRYVLETSTTLRDWTPQATNTAPFTVEIESSGGAPVRFFRARSWE